LTNSTRGKKNEERRYEEKEDIGFGLGLLCESYNVNFIKARIFYCNNVDPKGQKLASQVNSHFFFPLGPSQGNNAVVLKEWFFFFSP
jgi:hypothetical protein